MVEVLDDPEVPSVFLHGMAGTTMPIATGTVYFSICFRPYKS